MAHPTTLNIDEETVVSKERRNAVAEDAKLYASFIDDDTLKNRPRAVPIRGQDICVLSFVCPNELRDYRKDPMTYLGLDSLNLDDDTQSTLLTKIENLFKVIVRVEGTFQNADAAQKHIDRACKLEPCFDWYIAETQGWYPVPHREPKPGDPYFEGMEFRYENKQLTDIIRGQYENQEQVKLMHKERKEALIEKSMKEAKAKREVAKSTESNKENEDPNANVNDTVVSDSDE